MFVTKLQNFFTEPRLPITLYRVFSMLTRLVLQLPTPSGGVEFLARKQKQMPARKRDLRKALWLEVVFLLILAVPIVAWASGMTSGIGATRATLAATEPTALTLLGSALITLGVLIRRFKS